MAGQTESVVILNDEHTKCSICFNAFSTEISSTDEEVQRQLPVLMFKHLRSLLLPLGCVRDRQAAISEVNNEALPERIACMPNPGVPKRSEYYTTGS